MTKNLFTDNFKATVKLIRKKIVAMGISVTDAAKIGGISFKTLYAWLRGVNGKYYRAKNVLKKLDKKSDGEV